MYNVLDHLCPKDAQSLVNALGEKLDSNERNWYFGPVRYIFTSRKWFSSRVLEGYQFTILSCNLDNVLCRGENEKGYDEIAGNFDDSFVLIVVRNKKVVPLFGLDVERAGFSYRETSSWNKRFDNCEPTTRHVAVHRFTKVIEIITPETRPQSTMVPYFMNHAVAALSLIVRGEPQYTNYCHLHKDDGIHKSIGEPLEELASRSLSLEATVRRLVRIQIPTNKDMLYVTIDT